MKKNILKYSLFGFVLLSGFFSWFSIYRAMKIPEASIWLVPMVWFSLYIISIYLITILIHQEIAVEFVIILSFLMSLIFTFSIVYFIILFFCVFIVFSAVRAIKKDLVLNTKVKLWGTLFVGKLRIVFVLALLISSQYFFFASKVNGQKNVPKFDASPISSKIIEPFLGFINPDFKKIKEDGLTVDQFILENQKNNADNSFFNTEDIVDQQIPENLSIKQKETLKQQALQQIND